MEVGSADSYSLLVAMHTVEHHPHVHCGSAASPGKTSGLIPRIDDGDKRDSTSEHHSNKQYTRQRSLGVELAQFDLLHVDDKPVRGRN